MLIIEHIQPSHFSFFKGDAWVIRLNKNGEIQWQKTYGSCGLDAIFSIQQTQDDGYVMASMSLSIGVGHSDFWVVKLDPSGDIQWQKVYGGREHDIAHSIQQTSDGGYIAAGWTQSFGKRNLNAWILKLSADRDISSCQGGLIGTIDVIPYNTKDSVRRSSARVQDTHISPQESHQSVMDTYVTPSDGCND